MLVLGMEVGVVVSGAVRPAVPAVHRAVQRVEAGVGVLLLRDPLRRAAYVQDLGVVPLPGLALPQLPGLGLDPDGEDSIAQVSTSLLVMLINDERTVHFTAPWWYFDELQLASMMLTRHKEFAMR